MSKIVLAQDEEKLKQIIEQRIEFIGDNLEDPDLDLTAYFDVLYNYAQHPIDLNQTSFEQLSELGLLTDIQVQSILNYIERFGEMLTIYELGAVETIDQTSLEMILPFVTVNAVQEEFSWKRAFLGGKHELIGRYERVVSKKNGYSDPGNDSLVNVNKQYLGSADKIYFRYRKEYKNRLSWGFTADKDAGEDMFGTSNPYGFDFYSAHLFFRDLGRFKKLAVGDYQMSIGQGLTMWSGFAMGKTAEVFSLNRYAGGLRPYTSANENQFLRGAGATIEIHKNIDVSLFGSYSKIDGNLLIDDSLNQAWGFSSFQESGYHRTMGEVQDEDAVGQFVSGSEVSYHGKKLRLGLASVYTRFDSDLSFNTQPYNQYYFSGRSLLTTGLNYRFFHKKASFFGEVSVSDNLGMASINGVSWKADSRLDIILQHRYYDREFQSLHANVIGETSRNAGEHGMYFGVKMRLTPELSASLYFDQFRLNHFKSQVDDHSIGSEIFTQLDYVPNRKSKVYLRFRMKLTEQNSSEDEIGLDQQVDRRRINLRFHFEHKINRRIVLKSRVEWSDFKMENDLGTGVLLYQDLVYEFKKAPLKIYGRVAVFDVTDYEARIYAYENDLLYSFSVPSYYNRGIRSYLMLKYKPLDRVGLWLRCGLWSFQNVDSISSGLEEIQGSEKLDVKVQMRIKL